MKKIKSTSFHQYSWSSEVETTWISLFGWHHKTSNTYSLRTEMLCSVGFQPEMALVMHLVYYNLARFLIFSWVNSLWQTPSCTCFLYSSLNIRRLMGSTNQADPSCIYFRISWILMERPWFYFFCPLHLLRGLRSTSIK